MAASATGLSRAEALAHLTARDILLDWPSRIESMRAGQAVISTAVNLIVRFCPRVRLRPRTTFSASIADLIRAIDSSADPFGAASPDALHVALGGGPAGSARITASADGWVAYLSGCGDEVPELHDSENVLGALAAAAFVASETWRQALPLKAAFAEPTNLTAYSVYEYGPPTHEAPTVGVVHLRQPLLAGVGAVGQACVDALVWQRAQGTLDAVDRGYVDDTTNLNRSVLALERDLADKTAKVELAVRRASGSGLHIEPHLGQLEDVIARIDAGELPWPTTVASALDAREPRLALQGLWPDLVLEGATGDTMVQVFRHAYAEGHACLRCVHNEEPATANYEKTMAERSGLSEAEIAAALQDTSKTVSAEVIAKAPEAVRAIAAAHIGKGVCGYLSALEHFFGATTNEPTLLSVSFTSYLAGVFLASELLKEAAGLRSRLSSRYQIDPIACLTPEGPFVQNKDASCYCVQRADTISRYRDLIAARS